MYFTKGKLGWEKNWEKVRYCSEITVGKIAGKTVVKTVGISWEKNPDNN